MTTRRSPIQPPARRGEGGQILAIFAVVIVALLAVAGLALDGGSVFAHRRDSQNAVDLAALAAANDYLVNQSEDVARTRARTVAASNRFTHGTDGTTVDVAFDTSNGIKVTVDVGSIHHNSIVGVIGMPTWAVATHAAALAGFPDTAFGAGPFIFSAEAFQTDGTPFFTTETTFGTGNGDIPEGAQDVAWTNYGTGNVDTDVVRAMMAGTTVIDKTLSFGEYIGQHNNGNHASLYDTVNTYLQDVDLPVAIVDANGNFVGWATFHVVSADVATKSITGYFKTEFQSARLTISACALNDCPRYLGSYVLKLVE
jgi:Flp pilus assembly protein TadG